MIELVLDQASVQHGGADLLRAVSIRFRSGEMTAVLGPNGAGKSTLLRAALGLVALSGGSVHLGSAPIGSLSATARARTLSYLPQIRPLAWPVKVRDAVALGRFAYGTRLGRESETDAIAITRAMDACALTPLRDRRTDTLSGGELARVHLARAFAAEAPLLLADEPIAALDPRHQLEIMSLCRAHADAGRGVVLVLHDPSLAARFADRLVWMAQGQICADGTPQETLDAARMALIYGVEAEIEMKEGRPQATLIRSLQA